MNIERKCKKHVLADSTFEIEQISTNFCEIEAHSSSEIKQFSTKIGEIEAHSSFLNLQLSTKIGEIEAQKLDGRNQKEKRNGTNFQGTHSLREKDIS